MKLTKEDKNILSMAIMEEAKGVTMHEYPKNETLLAVRDYKRQPQDEINISVLTKVLDFWKIYFSEGEDAARAKLEDARKQAMAQIEEEKNSSRESILNFLKK